MTPSGYFFAGQTYLGGRGSPREALEWYARGIEACKEVATNHWGAGFANSMLGRGEAAFESYRACLEADANYARCYEGLTAIAGRS